MRSVAQILSNAATILIDLALLLIFVNWIFQLVEAAPDNPIVRTVRSLVGPFLDWLRRRLPFLAVGGWDFTPVAAWFILLFLQRALSWGLARL